MSGDWKFSAVVTSTALAAVTLGNGIAYGRVTWIAVGAAWSAVTPWTVLVAWTIRRRGA